MTLADDAIAYLKRAKPGDLVCRLTITDGRESQGGRTTLKGGYQRKGMDDVVATTDQETRQLTKKMVEEMMPRLNRSFAGSHRNAIHDDEWLSFYNASAGPVAWPCKDRYGGDDTPVQQKSIPCWTCGIVLPLQAIQVDHSRPQAGDQNEAVAKLFRHRGMTVAAPKGDKGLHYSSRSAEEHSTKRDRYTLNPVGRMFYQIIVEAGLKDTLRFNALHNFANLRPMCAQCNTARNSLPANKF